MKADGPCSFIEHSQYRLVPCACALFVRINWRVLQLAVKGTRTSSRRLVVKRQGDKDLYGKSSAATSSLTRHTDLPIGPVCS